MRKTISAVVAALATIGFAGGAMAADTSITIDYSDLDVTTAEGAAALDARISAAARKVCREVSEPGVRAFQDYIDCKEAARAKAMEQLTPTPVAFGNPYEGLELASIF